MKKFNIGSRAIGEGEPTYFIADISANHDGELDRAIKLVHLAAESGADAAKFQNFRAQNIVSSKGFESLGAKLSHQQKWKKSVVEIYQDATLPWEWTEKLKDECDNVGIDYFSTPYDLETVDMLDPYVPLYKIGSGDITWTEMLEKVASKKKPVLLATGASTICDVQRAMDVLLPINSQLCLMQCNTNYTAASENFKYINLNVLNTFRIMYPDIILGLSDHTIGHSTALGAIALGADVIEKHFTDDCRREGPDHPFSMTPKTWKEMVDRARELELSLGSANKKIEMDEIDTVIAQRRCIRAKRDLLAGTVISRDHLEVLRPAPQNSIMPFDLNKVIGMRLRNDLYQGEQLCWSILERCE
jgi:sialic acid synthase SpsE